MKEEETMERTGIFVRTKSIIFPHECVSYIPGIMGLKLKLKHHMILKTMPCHMMPKTFKAAPFTHRVVLIFYELVNDAILSFYFRVCLPRPGLTSFDVGHSSLGWKGRFPCRTYAGGCLRIEACETWKKQYWAKLGIELRCSCNAVLTRSYS